MVLACKTVFKNFSRRFEDVRCPCGIGEEAGSKKINDVAMRNSIEEVRSLSPKEKDDLAINGKNAIR